MNPGPTLRAPPGPWLFTPALDLLVGCGGWSLPLLGMTFYLTLHETFYLSFAFYFLGVFCNQPHYMATVYRAYRTPGDFNKYRFFTVYVTLFAILAVLIVHLAPGLFPWLLTFYLTWSPWHYTGQNYGIAMMLARRAGAQPNGDVRHLLWVSYAASYGTWFLALHNAGTAGGPTLVTLPIPVMLARYGELFFFLLYLVAGGYSHFRLVQQVGARALSGPLTLFVTQFLWFLLPQLLRVTTDLALPPTYSSAGILAFMHCAQYLWITTYYARREAESAPAGATPGFRLGHYYLVLVVGGLALFVPGPWLASRVFGHDFVESFFIFAALVNLHHFILDGAIWKLRDGRIARLLVGRNPPAGETEAVPEASGGSISWRWLFGPATPARWLRYGLGGSILGLGLLDQTQFWLTLKHAGGPALSLAEAFNPQDTRVYMQRAHALIRTGRNAEAIDQLRRAVAINPRAAPAQQLLGELLFRSGDRAAALAHYDRMAELLRPDLVVLVNSGVLASERGDLTKAQARFAAALRLAPEKTELHLYLAETLEKSGDVAGGIREYELYAQLHAADAAEPGNLANCLNAALRLGDLYAAQHQPDRAATWYRRMRRLAAETTHIEEMRTAEERLRQLGLKPSAGLMQLKGR